MANCPFCPDSARYFLELGTAAAIYDHYPVNKGHVLVVPKAHRTDLFQCTPEEVADMWQVISKVKGVLDREHGPDAYNIGTNAGEAAGQTVFHCHIHVIPRFKGDCDSPRGGVRRVKVPLVEY